MATNVIIELNVGGKHLDTMMSTLTKYEHTRLARMFSKGEDLRIDKNGRCFIDCNGSVFEYILDFLRFDSLPNHKVSREVYALAKYFGLQDIMLKHKHPQEQWGDGFIELNVRGTIITVEKNSLSRFKDSKLGSIFKTDPKLQTDNSGMFYIDCDPGVFQCILDKLAGDGNFSNCSESVQEAARCFGLRYESLKS